MARLFLLLTLVPVVEIAVLVWIGRETSLAFVIALVIGTGILGAWLARHQGLKTLRRIQSEIALGHMPSESLLDGLLVLLAAVLLILPGVLTDLVAIALLFPPSRDRLKRLLRDRLAARVVARRYAPFAGEHVPLRDQIIDVKVIEPPSSPRRG